MPATYVEAIYLGLTISHLVRLPDGTEIVARVISGEPSDEVFEPGRDVTVGWPGDRARLHVA